MTTSIRLRRIASLAAIAAVPLAALLPIGADVADAGVHYDGTGKIVLVGTAQADDDAADDDDGAGSTTPLANSHFVTDSRPDPGPTDLTIGDTDVLPTGTPIAGSPLVVRG